MKALFCYDGPLYKDEYGDYYDSILNDQMFQRYFNVADELEVLIRIRNVKREDVENKMSRLTDSRIKVVECPNLASVSGLLKDSSTAKKILKDRIKKAEICFCRLPSVIGNYSVDICKKLCKKYLVEVVGCPWDSYTNYSYKGKLVAPFAMVAMKKRVYKAPFVLYVTNQFLQKRYPTKGQSINCSNVELPPVNDEILSNRLKRIASCKSTSKYTIGTAAGLDVLYKGQQYVIGALAELKKRGITNIEYQLIGGGTGNYLKKVAKDLGVQEQLIIVGQMPHDKVFEWMDNLDFYAQPSRQEGLPRSMIEAMSRGLPCIGAKTAGIPELIETEYIFPNTSDEINEIANILEILINNTEKCRSAATVNFEEAKKYQKEILVARRTEFFKKCISS